MSRWKPGRWRHGAVKGLEREYAKAGRWSRPARRSRYESPTKSSRTQDGETLRHKMQCGVVGLTNHRRRTTFRVR